MPTTAITAPSSIPETLPAPGDVHRITVDRYERMIAGGLVDEGDRVELLGGVLVNRMAQGPDHVWAVDELAAQLDAMAAGEWHARKEHPARLSEYDEPEPDVAVVLGPRSGLRGRHPVASEIPLVVEVAGTTQAEDRGIKQERYARAGIPTYWIVNLQTAVVEVYTDPDAVAGCYRGRADFGPGMRVPVVLSGTVAGEIAVADLMPRA
ncbi:MAG: Uma2 family endonuclease [Isosphaeraceae bacterium]